MLSIPVQFWAAYFKRFLCRLVRWGSEEWMVMGSSDINNAASGMASGLLLAGAVSLLALPSAVLAFSAGFARKGDSAAVAKVLDGIEAKPAQAQLARAVPMRSLAKGKLYLFTPAASPSRPDRSITVAVRVDPQTAKAISVRGASNGVGADGDAASLRIAPTGFSLGVARGYHNFSQNLVPPADSRKGEMPDLSQFSIAPKAGGEDARFNPRIVIDEKKALGRAPRTFAGESEDQVDVGGSLRVTRNLNVTAGVRYSQERDRLRPLTDGKQDGQAVYLGTQFRF